MTNNVIDPLQLKRVMRAPPPPPPPPQLPSYLSNLRMRRFGNILQRFSPNVPTFRRNVRANLSNFIQDLFWHVTFSNEDFKMVEDDTASLAIVKIWTWVFLDQHAAQSVGCEEESKKIYFCIKSKQVKKKVRRDTLKPVKVQGVYLLIGLAWFCLWGSPSSEIGIHIFIISVSWDRRRPTYICSLMVQS